MAYTIRLTGGADRKNVLAAIAGVALKQGLTFEPNWDANGTITIKRVRWAIDGSNLLQEEWKKFNSWMNDALDKEGVIADVWSTPFSVKGRLWIRRGDRRVA